MKCKTSRESRVVQATVFWPPPTGRVTAPRVKALLTAAPQSATMGCHRQIGLWLSHAFLWLMVAKIGWIQGWFLLPIYYKEDVTDKVAHDCLLVDDGKMLTAYYT